MTSGPRTLLEADLERLARGPGRLRWAEAGAATGPAVRTVAGWDGPARSGPRDDGCRRNATSVCHQPAAPTLAPRGSCSRKRTARTWKGRSSQMQLSHGHRGFPDQPCLYLTLWPP